MRISLAVLLLPALVAIGCGGPLTYKMASSPKAVGADGTLQATIYQKEHETKLIFNVKDLAPASRITPDAKVFVVWGRKDTNATWQRVGNVVYQDSDRTGVFKGSFPETEFDLEVSVEKDDSIAAPSSDIVFSQHVGPG